VSLEGAAGFDEVAGIRVEPEAGRVYEMGWQSWSPSAVYPVAATSTRPACAFNQVFYRPELPAPARGFQGEGLLAVEPEPGGGVHVIAGEHGRGSVPSIRAELCGNELVVSANGSVRHVIEPAGVSLYAALARFADSYGAAAGARKPASVPPIWASWYQYFTEFSQVDLEANLKAMDRLELPVGIVRLDDAFQAGIGDWLTGSTRFESIAEAIKLVLDRGRAAGIWNAPFLVGSKSQAFEDHPDWLVRDRAGALVRAHYNWGQDCFVLDVTHPGAAEYLRRVLSTYRECGASYFMVDFLYAGAMDGVRHADVDGLEAYRAGMALIRDSIGEDALLQGCGAPMFPSVGYVDTMRVGADIAPHYGALGDELADPGGESAVVSTVGRAFTQGRLWLNDPDCLLARPAMERREQWAEVVRRYGAVRISSDGLDELDSWGLEVTRELLVAARLEPFDEEEVPLSHPAVDTALRGRDRFGRVPERGR